MIKIHNAMNNMRSRAFIRTSPLILLRIFFVQRVTECNTIGIPRKFARFLNSPPIPRGETFPFADFTPKKTSQLSTDGFRAVKKYVTGRENWTETPESCRKSVKCKTVYVDENGFEGGQNYYRGLCVEWNEKNDVDHFFFFFLITIKTLPFSMIHISFNKNYFIGRNIIISTWKFICKI